MFKHSRVLLIVFAALLGGAFARGPSPCAASAAGPANTWYRFAARHHCFLVVEGAYVGKRLRYVGSPPALPQDIKTIPTLVKWLRAKLPACTVWRDRLNNHIIHVVYTKALKWKANPLNQRLTFRGTMSMKQVVSGVVGRRFPRVAVLCLGDQRNYLLPGGPNPAITKAYETLLRFDVVDMTLREFLTDGLVYDLSGPQPPVNLWEASYFLRHGKFTGRVDITIFGVPLRPAAPPPATAPAHHRERHAGK